MDEPESQIDLLPDGVVIADAEGVVTAVNGMARRLLGPAAVVGAKLPDVMARLSDGRLRAFCHTLTYDEG